jgi:hypothetical protein
MATHILPQATLASIVSQKAGSSRNTVNEDKLACEDGRFISELRCRN